MQEDKMKITRRQLRRIIEQSSTPSKATHWGSAGTLDSGAPEEDRYGVSPQAAGKKVGQAANPKHAYRTFGPILQDITRRVGINAAMGTIKSMKGKSGALFKYYTLDAGMQGMMMALMDLGAAQSKGVTSDELKAKGLGEFTFESCTGANKYAIVDLDRGRVLIKDTVKFVTGKSDIKPESLGLLDAVVCLMNNPTGKPLEEGLGNLRVEGHTDSDGSDDMNMRLSNARAKSIAEYLIQAGMAADRVSSVGFGETRPIADNRTSSGKAKNRRVEFHLTAVEDSAIRNMLARSLDMPKLSQPMTSQHPDFPPELKINEGNKMKITRRQLNLIINEAADADGDGALSSAELRRLADELEKDSSVDPVDKLVAYIQTVTPEDEIGLSEVEDMLRSEGHSAEKIDSILEDPRLDQYYDALEDIFAPGGGHFPIREGNKIKITRRKLRQLINEAVGRLPTSNITHGPGVDGSEGMHTINSKEEAQMYVDQIMSALTISQKDLAAGNKGKNNSKCDQQDEALLNDLMAKMDAGNYPFDIPLGIRS